MNCRQPFQGVREVREHRASIHGFQSPEFPERHVVASANHEEHYHKRNNGEYDPRVERTRKDYRPRTVQE